MESLKGSMRRTENIEEASIILVYDYCLLITAMADHRARGHWYALLISFYMFISR